jgi:hypothetical protein
MSLERIRQVLDFSKPEKSKQLKSFLGLVIFMILLEIRQL